jgi:hypothetical protein
MVRSPRRPTSKWPSDVSPADRLPSVIGKRPGRGVGRCQLPEHDRDDQDGGQRTIDESSRSGLVDDHTRPNEQAGSDHGADRDDGQVTLLETFVQLGRFPLIVTSTPMTAIGPRVSATLGDRRPIVVT